MTNIEALLAVVSGSDPKSVGLEANSESDNRYERLFAARQNFITKLRGDPTNDVSPASPEDTELAFVNLLAVLMTDFNDLPERDDIPRVHEILSDVISRREAALDCLTDSELRACEDVIVNIGMFRVITNSYGFMPEMGLPFMKWMMRFRIFMLVA